MNLTIFFSDKETNQIPNLNLAEFSVVKNVQLRLVGLMDGHD